MPRKPVPTVQDILNLSDSKAKQEWQARPYFDPYFVLLGPKFEALLIVV